MLQLGHIATMPIALLKPYRLENGLSLADLLARKRRRMIRPGGVLKLIIKPSGPQPQEIVHEDRLHR